MATFVGHNSAAATSVTLPTGTQEGDLAIVFAYRTAVTAPTVPTGWSSAVSSSGNANAGIVGFKYLAGTEVNTGTWTNATVVHVVVYRAVRILGASAATTKAASITANIPTLSLLDTGGASWVLAFAGSKQATSQGTPLAGATTSRGTQTGTTADTIAADTNGGVTSFAATTSANGSSVTSFGASVELLTAAPIAGNLRDTLQNGAVDMTKWNPTVAAGLTITETTQLNIAIAAAAGYATLYSLVGYSVYGSFVSSRLISAGDQTLAMDVLPVLIQDGSGNDALFWDVSGNTLFADYVLGGSTVVVRSDTTYVPGLHVWFRIRETGGTIYWEWSQDGGSWNVYATLPMATFTVGLADMLVGIQMGIFGTAGTTTTQYDNFNTGTYSPGPPPLHIANRNVGPMALRQLFKQPYYPQTSVSTGPNNYTQALTAGASFSGNLNKQTAYIFTASLSFTGALGKLTGRTFTGSLTYTGAMARLITFVLASGLSFTGLQTKAIAYIHSANLGFTGSFSKMIARPLSGALSFTGALAKGALRFLSLTASLSFTGAMKRSVNHGMSAGASFSGNLTKAMTRSLAAALSFTGSLAKRMARALTGALSFTGSFLSGAAHFLSLTAGASFTGTMRKQTNVPLTGSLSFTGALGRLVAKLMAASLSFTGNLLRRIARSLTAAVSFTGGFIVGSLHKLSLTATASFSGALTKRGSKNLSAGASFTGTLKHMVGKSFPAALSFAGSLRRAITKVVSSSVTFTGTLLHAILKKVSFTGALSFTGSLAHTVLGRVIVTVIRRVTIRGGHRKPEGPNRNHDRGSHR